MAWLQKHSNEWMEYGEKNPHILMETLLAFPSLLGLELGMCGTVLPPTRHQRAKAQFPCQGKE